MKTRKISVFLAALLIMLLCVSCAASRPDISVPVDKDEYPPVVDESITGTLYTVIPDSDEITVFLKLNSKSFFIYETSGGGTSSFLEDGSNYWTLKNALYRPCYHYFVIDNASGNTFECSCEYLTETLTCKAFIDGQYERLKDYYEVIGGVALEKIYSRANRALQNNFRIDYDELFF